MRISFQFGIRNFAVTRAVGYGLVHALYPVLEAFGGNLRIVSPADSTETQNVPHFPDDSLVYVVPRGTEFPRAFSLPRGIVTVLIQLLGALGVGH